MWSKPVIKNHQLAADALDKIKDNVFRYLRESSQATELEVQQFILGQYKSYNLKTDQTPTIVAFGESSTDPHYDPSHSLKKLANDSLIMIDIWARLAEENSPFADITWMAWHGDDIPMETQNVFNAVIAARDASLRFIEERLKAGEMPTGKSIDDKAREIIAKAGFGEGIKHTTGHSIGFTSPHGLQSGIRQSNLSPLEINLGYTIEPGIYLNNKFGIRSEIDFYINENKELIITTEIQKELILI